MISGPSKLWTMLSLTMIAACSSASSPGAGADAGPGDPGLPGSGGGTDAGSAKASRIVVDDAKAWDVLVDGDTLYWTSEGDRGGILKSKLDGSGETVVWSETGKTPESMALDADSVYAVSSATNIVRVPKAGGAGQLLLEDGKYYFIGSQGLAVDDSGVYFGAGDPKGAGYTIGKVAKTGGAVTILASGTKGGVTSLAVDDANVYFGASELITGSTMRVAKSGGTPTVFDPKRPCYGAQVVGGKLYCIGADDLHTFDVATGAVTGLSSSRSIELWVDGADVFHFGQHDYDRALYRTPTAGGEPVPLAQTGPYALRLTANARTVFFSDLNDGKIRAADR